MSCGTVLFGEALANYIIENNLSYFEASKNLNISWACLNARMVRIRKVNDKLYTKAREVSSLKQKQITREEIANKTVIETGTLDIAKWMVDNNETLKNASKKFGINYKTLGNRMQNIRYVDEDLYKKVSNLLKFNRTKRSEKNADDSSKCKMKFKDLPRIEQEAIINYKKIKFIKEHLNVGDTLEYYMIVPSLAERSDGTYKTVYIKTKVTGIITAKYSNYLMCDGNVVYFNDCIIDIGKLKKI